MKTILKTNYFFGLIILLNIVFSCTSSKNKSVSENIENCNLDKIKFKLSIFDKNGLTSDENNKVALDYEFCVPNTPEILTKISEIDSSIKPIKGKGRTKCTDNAILLTGNSYNKDIKKILCNLSQLEYITEINQVFWE